MVSYKGLEHLMVEHEMIWKDLHEKAGIGWTTISKINKKILVSDVVIKKLAKYFNVDISDIIEIRK